MPKLVKYTEETFTQGYKAYALLSLFQIFDISLSNWTLIHDTCLTLFSSSGKVTAFYQASNLWLWQGSGKNAVSRVISIQWQRQHISEGGKAH